ncbi:unnamed protein product [Peronospora effusa]|nr:unnamed protein product [Peronospora effusa]
MGIIGDPSTEQLKLPEKKETQPKLLKAQEEKEAESKLLKEQEEKEAQVKLLKEQEEQEGKFERLNDWNEISASFTSQLDHAKDHDIKNLMYGGTYGAKQNLDELLEGWKPPDKDAKSKSKSSTIGLQDWLAERESPDKLFTVLGIHKAVDKSANSLLISMNLERWNFAMQLSDKTGHYNFEDKLKETLKTFCGDDKRATLFLRRLAVLRGNSRRYQLKWLHEMEDPERVFKHMKVVKDTKLNKDSLTKWSKYVDAHNDLYPQSQTTLSAYFSESKEKLIEMILLGVTVYPNKGYKRRMLDEILESWANEKPLISPAEVFDHFEKALKKGKDLSAVGEGKELSTVEEGKEQSTVEEGKELSTVEKGKELSTVEEGELISTVPLRGLKNYMALLNVGKQMGEKSKDESPSNDARDRQRPRGE